MLLCGQLVADQILQCLGVGGGGELTVADFLVFLSVLGSLSPAKPGGVYLDVASHVRLDGLEGGGTEDIWPLLALLCREW